MYRKMKKEMIRRQDFEMVKHLIFLFKLFQYDLNIVDAFSRFLIPKEVLDELKRWIKLSNYHAADPGNMKEKKDLDQKKIFKKSSSKYC